MPADSSNRFQSVLTPCMEKFLQEKHACGYAYHEATRILRRLDDFLVQEGLTIQELPGSVTRQFSRFLLRLGHSAYVPDFTLATRNRSTFVPRMLTDEELRKFFRAVDALEPTARSPLRHLNYAGSFSAPVWLRVPCRRIAETTHSRRRSESRHHHGTPGEMPQRSLGSPRLAPRKPLAKVRCPF